MEYLKIWTSFREVIDPLNDSERGRLFTAMLEYAELGTVPDFKGNERFIWPSAKQAIDRARAESERLTVNGSKGGRPKKTNGNQRKPTETKENQQEPTETQKEKEKKNKEREEENTSLTGSKRKPLARFTPPTVEQVAAYCQERGNRINAQQFVDFYASKGWKVGQNPMKDWRACIRTWEGRDGPGNIPAKPPKTVSAQAYGQRQYTEAELLAVSDDLVAEARKARDTA